MSLQKSILLKLKRKYPDSTLKQLSEISKIQTTRVFRLFNGSEMKLSEYEKLLEAVDSIDSNSKIDRWVNELPFNERTEYIQEVSSRARLNLYRGYQIQ